jgi:flavodoxin
MKTLITYYSFSGNTDRVAKIFADSLKAKGEVMLQRLKPTDDITGFALQCRAAFTKKRAKLDASVNFDASSFDLVILGSPVWAFAPVPAINSYLDNLNGLHGKRIVVLLTSGSGLGVNRCFNNIRDILRSKGAASVDYINIPDRKQGDTGFIAAAVSKYLQ